MGWFRVGRCHLFRLTEPRMGSLQGTAGRRKPVEGALPDDKRGLAMDAARQRALRAGSSPAPWPAGERLPGGNELHPTRPRPPLVSTGSHAADPKRRPELASPLRDVAQGTRGILWLARLESRGVPAPPG